jgi:transposase
VILKKKLLPWAKKHALAYPGIIVQEDGALAHASKHQIPVWNMAKVKRLLWPGNSPDLNAIEPCWWYIKY